MPELPEVETIRRQLEPALVDAIVVDAGSHWSTKFTPALDAVDQRIVALRRRGKYLIADLVDLADSADLAAPADLTEPTEPPPPPTQRELIIHLGMTGRLAVEPAARAPATDTTDHGVEPHPHLRAWWRLDDERILTFHDARRFGRIHVVVAGEHAGIPTLHALGPEPFDDEFTGAGLAAFVKRSNRHLKTILLGQRAVAGVGNIYADEALWLARINPATRRLSRDRAEVLVDTIRTALQSGLDHGGTTLRDYVDSEGATGENQHELFCYGRAGEPCLRCGAELRRRELDARSTTWCPVCQAR